MKTDTCFQFIFTTISIDQSDAVIPVAARQHQMPVRRERKQLRR